MIFSSTLQFTSIRRLLREIGELHGVRFILAVHIHPQIVTSYRLCTSSVRCSCSSHPSADCYILTVFLLSLPASCSSHPSADCYSLVQYWLSAQCLAVHIHPQIVTAISCVQQVYPTLSIEQPGNMDMIIGSISEEIRQHSCERLFPFLFTLDSHIVAAPHDKIFFTVFVVFSFYVSRISGHSVCHCTHIPGHHPILLAYHLQLQTDFYAVEQVLLRNA